MFAPEQGRAAYSLAPSGQQGRARFYVERSVRPRAEQVRDTHLFPEWCSHEPDAGRTRLRNRDVQTPIQVQQENTTMFRKTVLALAATATVGLAATTVSTTPAAAWGWGHHHHHHHGHFWRGGYGFYGYGGGGCYVKRVVYTPWGPRVRVVNVCY
jgi:hypothetical protein